MSERIFNVLFVCQYNSARSIMAEALLRKWGMGRFNAYSAGWQPAGSVNPIALDLLDKVKADTSTLAPKHWDTFLTPDAPRFDMVFVVCDTTWARPMPTWPGKPLVARWGFPDPAAMDGSEVEKRALFNLVFGMIERRIKIFCALPDRRLSNLTAQDVSDIHTDVATPVPVA